MVIKTGNFLLDVEPAERVFFFGPFDKPSTRDVKLTNNARYAVAFKVKCSDNQIVKIEPPAGLLKIGETTTITLTADRRPNEMQNLYIMNIPVHANLNTAREAWEETPQEAGRIQMDIYFEEV